MDSQSFDILCRVVDGQIKRIDGAIGSGSSDQRGATYIRFVTLHLDAIESRIEAACLGYGGGTPFEKAVHARTVLRFKYLVDSIHTNVFDYRGDVGRRDLPVGLLHLIDRLLADLLRLPSDPIIHSQREYMYSTIGLKDQWSGVSAELGVQWNSPVEPIILNLPGLDPDNAFLSPILAHEVGHTVVKRNDLISAVSARLDAGKITALISDLQIATPNIDPSPLMDQFGRWTEELLCDALAAELTGPSLLFASAFFLPAATAGQGPGKDHPDASDRIRLSMAQLASAGWSAFLLDRCPETMGWLEAVSTPPPPTADPVVHFLRSLVLEALGPIADVAREFVGDQHRLTFDSYESIREGVEAFVDRGIPPAEIEGEPTSPWHVVAACWLRGLRVHGDHAAGLAMTALDRPLSNFALKSIEMSRVLQLWRASQ